jgi:hypothetical protein
MLAEGGLYKPPKAVFGPAVLSPRIEIALACNALLGECRPKAAEGGL